MLASHLFLGFSAALLRLRKKVETCDLRIILYKKIAVPAYKMQHYF